MKTISLLNMGFSNVESIKGAIECCGYDVELVDRIELVRGPLVLPGVGTFEHAMNTLSYYDNQYHLINRCRQGDAIIGICLGMQVMFAGSDEAQNVNGLGLLPGRLVKLGDRSLDGKLRLSHIGYTPIKSSGKVDLGQFSPYDGKSYYFMHSFGLLSEQSKIPVALHAKFNDKSFVAMFNHENLFGMQFHPERSGEEGIKLLKTILGSVIK